MSLEVKWLMEKRVVYGHLFGNITQENFHDFGRELERFLEKIEAPAYLVLDAGGVSDVPDDLSAMEGMVNHLQHPSLEWMISCGMDDPVFRYLSRLLTKASGAKHRLVKDVTEAQHFLELQDNTLKFG